jgi:cytochrome P450
MSDPREGEGFFLNVPEKLDNPFPDLKYFREHRPVFYYSLLQTWFMFRYADVSTLSHDARLSADRMKGFVDAAPADVRDELQTLASEGLTVLWIMEGEFLMLSEKILGVWETISALPRVWECGRPTSTMERV